MPSARSAARDAVRAAVPFLTEDRELGADITAVTRLVREGALAAAAEEAVGPLA